MLRIDRKLVFLDIEATHLDTLIARPWEIAMIERWPSGKERRTWIMIADVDTEHASERSLEVGRFAERHVNDGRSRWLSEEMAALWVARRLCEDHVLGRPMVVGSNVAGYDLPILAAMLDRHRYEPEWYHHPIDLVTWTQAREAQSPFGTVSLRKDGSYGLSELAGVPRPVSELAHTAMGDAQWARAWWDSVKGVIA